MEKIYQTTENFRKPEKLYFSNKGKDSNKLMLKEINRLISEEKQLATIKNTFFVNITESLDLKKDSDSSLNLFDSENKISQTFMINKKILF